MTNRTRPVNGRLAPATVRETHCGQDIVTLPSPNATKATLTGTLDDLMASLKVLGAVRDVTGHSQPHIVGDSPDGREPLWQVTVTMAPQDRPAQMPVERRSRVGLWVGVALSAVVLLAALGYAVFWVLAYIAANAAVVVTVLVLFAVVLGYGGGKVCTTVITVKHRH